MNNYCYPIATGIVVSAASVVRKYESISFPPIKSQSSAKAMSLFIGYSES
jgi:hypothetical protein